MTKKIHIRRGAESIGSQLTMNLAASMRVAGAARDDGKAGSLSSSELQRRTGIARSTYRAIKSPVEGHEPNPDLRTLSRLADELDIPVAFLLMRPKDWEALLRTLDGLADPLRAAERIVNGDYWLRGSADLVERVLRECRVHPELPPMNAIKDEVEQARLNARNEWRRRISHVLSALTLQAAHDRQSLVTLAALTASYVNQATPNDPDSAGLDSQSKKE